MTVSNSYYVDGCFVYKIATSCTTFKIYGEAFNQCHSGSEAAPFSPTLSQDCLAPTVLKVLSSYRGSGQQ